MQETLKKVIDSWKKEPRESAESLIDYYGDPTEISTSRLVWYNTFDGWKRTEIINEEIPHVFPAPHNDYVEQFIDYRVPVEMFEQLATYDGSVVVERTRGEISARCGGTPMNFVAINLAHDIVTGRRSVDEARDEYTKLYDAYKRGEKPAYTQAFQFEVAHGGTGDADVSTLR